MFKKIVSNLAFSPALVGQLGFYAKRLKKEETTRRLGLVFVALALVVQCLVVFQPPESANAAGSNDFVPGGLGLGSNRSLNNFLAPYDSNANHLQDIMNSVGISRAEIAAAQFGSFMTGTKYGWGHEPRAGGTAFSVYSGGSAVSTIYGSPLSILNGQTDIYGWIGYSSHIGWFAIMQACGNLVTDTIPPPVTPPTPANIVVSKTASNVSQGNVSASTIAAKENDKITYTLNLENKGGTAKLAKIEDNLKDTLEYSTLIDKGGGTFNDTTKTLAWPDVTLAPAEKQSRTFAVQVLATIPSTPKGQSDPESYNCIMNNAFSSGGSPLSGITIPVTCAPPKVIEHITTELPHTGATENMLFAGIVLAVVTYFFLRSKQLGTEVRLIRRDLNAGTI